MIQDVSETVGIYEGERTIACGEIGEGYLAQLTPSQARFCSLLPLRDYCKVLSLLAIHNLHH